MTRVFVHIGPSKTASTSIQAILPHLGRPYLIKPKWGKALARDALTSVKPFEGVPDGLIVSDEVLGDCDTFRPEVTSYRLWQLFGRCTIVVVHREYTSRIESLYRQFQALNTSVEVAFETFREDVESRGAMFGIGPYPFRESSTWAEKFAEHEVRVIDFSLLPRPAFLEALVTALEAPIPAVPFPHLNRSK